MKNLILRTVTGVLFVAVTVACLVYSPYSCIAFAAIIAMLATYEFCHIVDEHEGLTTMPYLNPVGTFILFSVILGGKFLHFPDMGVAMSFLPYIALLVVMFVMSLALYDKMPVNSMAFSVFSHIYIGVPFALLCLLGFETASEGETFSYVIPLSVFIFLWTNDTGAYCTGSLLHNKFPKKMSPNISPNKTWVGTTGGVVLCLVAAVILSHCFGRYSLTEWLVFAFIVSVFGTIGDLFESMLKRSLKIKDSGHILPGHGGFLDRFDSSLLAIPATYIYFAYINAVHLIY